MSPGIASAARSTSAAWVSHSAPTGGRAPSVVNIGEFAPTLPGSLNVAIAQGLGYYNKIQRQFHTTFEFEGFTSPPPIISGLVAGQLQMAEITPANVMTAAAAGETGFVDLENFTEGSGTVIIGGGSEASNGTGIAAIKAHYGCGTNWAITGLGGTSQITIEAIFNSLHLGVNCMNMLSVGTTGVIPAVTTGKAQVGLAAASTAASLIQQGQAYSVLFTSGTALYKLLGFEPSVGLVAEQSFVKKYPNLVQAIVLADLKGMLWLQKHAKDPAAAYALLPAAYQATTSLAAFQSTWDLYADAYTPDTGLFTTKDGAVALVDGQRYGGLPSNLTLKTVKGVANPTFLDNAYLDLGLTPPTSEIITKYLYNG